MPKVIITCQYCGHIENTYLYSLTQVYKCEVCKDKNATIKETQESDGNVFGYPLS